MAIYHLSVKIISRNKGRSSVGASAYRAGEKIKNEYDGITHNYSKRTDVIYKKILLPNNAPNEYEKREVLWNEVEKAEKRINSRTAREIEVALPIELSKEQQIRLVEKYVINNFINNGMCADICIHSKDNNPHAHIMLTTREVDENGFTIKNRDWDKKENIEIWRKNWADEINIFLSQNNINEKVDYRSFERQELEKLPTKHLGSYQNKLKKQGILTDKQIYNDEIKVTNDKIKSINEKIDYLQNKEYPNLLIIDNISKLRDEILLKKEEDYLRQSYIRNKESEIIKVENKVREVKEYINKYNWLCRNKDNNLKELNKFKGILGFLGKSTKSNIIDEINSIENDINTLNNKFYNEFNYNLADNINLINNLNTKVKNMYDEIGYEKQKYKSSCNERNKLIEEYKKEIVIGILNIDDDYLNDFLYTIKNYDKGDKHIFSNGESINKYLSYISTNILPREFENIKNTYLKDIKDIYISQDKLDYIKQFNKEKFYFKLFKDENVNNKFNVYNINRNRNMDYDLDR